MENSDLKENEFLEYARRNSAVASAVLRSGGSANACVFALVMENENLFKRLIELEAIAPRKIKVGEKTYIYRCPDHLVPEPR